MNRTTAMLGIVFLTLVLASQVTFALDLDVVSNLGEVGRIIEDLISNSHFRFGITFILFFMLMYAVFAAGLNKVEVFKGKGELPNKLGKIVAVSLGLMSSIGIAYGASYYRGGAWADNALEYMGWFGALAFGALIFGISYYNANGGEKNIWKTLALVSLGFAAYNAILGNANGFGVFAVLAFIFLLIYLFTTGKTASDGDGSSTGPGPGPTTTGNKPSAVQNFNASVAPGGVNLTWNANPGGENVQGYELQRINPTRIGVPGSSRWRWQSKERIWNLGANATSHTDNTASFNTNQTLNYRIRARNQYGSGPWQFTSVSVGTVTVTGKIVSGDGHDVPIDNLNVQITGPSTHTAASPTGHGGEPPGAFHINNVVPMGGGNHNIAINDPHNLFTETFTNTLNINNAQDGNIYIGNGGGVEIRLLPVAGHTATVTAKLQTPGGAPVAATPVYVWVSGGFGTDIFQTPTPDSSGKITINSVPAGYNVRLRIADHYGAYIEAVTGYKFLRVPGATVDFGTVKFNSRGSCQLSGKVYRWNYSMWPPIANTEVDLTSPNINNSMSEDSNINGDYQIDSIPSDPGYTVKARHKADQFYPLLDPVASPYPIVSNQVLNIPMLPKSPPPSGVAVHYDASGNLVFTVRF